MAFMEALNRLGTDVAHLQNEGVSPESEKAQALAKATLDMMLEATSGDERLMDKLAESLERMKSLDGEREDEFLAAQDFLRLAIDAYLIKSGHDPFENGG
jgi:hypothetical protein